MFKLVADYNRFTKRTFYSFTENAAPFSDLQMALIRRPGHVHTFTKHRLPL